MIIKSFLCSSHLYSAFIGLAGLGLFSCKERADIKAAVSQDVPMLPVTVDYRSAEGPLAYLVYRSTFAYDDDNRLLSITDKTLTESANPEPPITWAQFSYSNDVLTRIAIKSLGADLDAYDPEENAKPALFELTYADQTLNARLLLNGREIKKVSFALDQNGFPIKANAGLGWLSFDKKGNIDYITESQKHRVSNPTINMEVVEQQHDQTKNVFTDSREMQILTALLTATNRRISPSGLAALGNALETNNLIYLKWRQCTVQYGCTEFADGFSKTLTVNDSGFPTQRLCSAGAMGTFQFDITYKQAE